MSDEKVKKSEQNLPKPESEKGKLIKGEINRRLYSEQPIKEGYQPTDKLDTSNPPTDKGKDKSE
jgi:hypothetical protein